jgi:subtilase family serine protease
MTKQRQLFIVRLSIIQPDFPSGSFFDSNFHFEVDMRRDHSLPLAGTFLVLLAVSIAFVQTGYAREIPAHTAKFVQSAPDLGPTNASQLITIKVHLQNRNADLEGFIQQLHDPGSPNYRKWLTAEQFKARFGASPRDVATVQKFLTDHNLRVVGSDSMAITARGTVGSIQRALHVQLRQFSVGGKEMRANTSNPVIDGPAGELVSAVSGLTEDSANAYNVLPVDENGNAIAGTPLDQLGPNGLFFSGQCFRPAQTVTLNGVVANVPAGNPLAGDSATASYTGLRYGADITNTTVGTLPPCGYQPSEIQTAYELNQVYSQGLDGTGQTIVIIDAFGSPSLASDVALFDQLYGLPAINLTQIVVNGPITLSNASFASETTLDVEWAHAIAPGAKIVLVLAKNSSFTELNNALAFAVDNHLGNVISNSFGAPESEISGATIAATEALIAQGAAEGISVNYSSGDSGDFSIQLGPGVTTVSYPASSPFGTAVGGTSLATNSDNTLNFQTGWGNNLTRLSLAGAGGVNNPVVPPSNSAALGLGFQFGSGGGASGVFLKPQFQRKLKGNARFLPDISYLADPFTGVEIIQTVAVGTGHETVVEVIGGTSLACPMFSALWAISNQAAGGGPLGQAAQLLYDLPGDAIDDIKQFSLQDVSGFTLTPAGFTFESPEALSAPLFNQSKFVSALRQGSSTSWFNVTFGTDSSLTIDNGWDDVTGLGTPSAPKFVKEITKGK